MPQNDWAHNHTNLRGEERLALVYTPHRVRHRDGRSRPAHQDPALGARHQAKSLRCGRRRLLAHRDRQSSPHRSEQDRGLGTDPALSAYELGVDLTNWMRDA